MSCLTPTNGRRALAVALATSIFVPGAALADDGGRSTPPRTDATTTWSDIAALTGADDLWAQGLTGRGVDVALIDSGVTPVAGLDGPGKLVNGPDLSFDSQNPATTRLDALGHGTHLAGLIAGNGPGNFRGTAPGARLVNVKVGGANGAVDVSQVIAALDWVVQHKNDGGLNIRVVNLSLGTDSRQDAAIDPLSKAVDNAWRAGIVVVAAVGNDGNDDHRVASPASNPNILAVGATDSAGSTEPSDSAAAEFSAVGKHRRPDLVAPGARVQSLRVPGSLLDSSYPEARRGQRWFRGSGTSQSAAVVSGAAALLLQQRPALTPDQVKSLLLSTAAPVEHGRKQVSGRGQLDIAAAAEKATPRKTQHLTPISGTGSLDAARGSHRLVMDGVPLRGEIDVRGNAFHSAAHAARSTLGQAWQGGVWNGASWSGASWSGASWSGASWSGASWSGASWSGASWSGASWSGASWSGASWSGASWSGASCSGASWSGASWSGGSWSGASWSGAS